MNKLRTLKLIKNLGETWNRDFSTRVSRKQKERFLAAIEQELHSRQFETERVVVRKLFRNHNLLTKCEQPRIIFTAHYDTPTIMPFFFSWLFRLFGHTRQVMMLIFLMVLLFVLPSVVLPQTPTATLIQFGLMVALLLSFLSLLIPNPSNAEDNTSGVIGLLALADWVSQQEGLKEQVQFAFFDNEELGLLGSGAQRWLWDQRSHPYEAAMIINLDCVSRGDVPLIVYHYDGQLAEKVLPTLQPFLPKATPIDMTYLPLSDNYTFRDVGGIDITYADRSLLPGGYFIPRIHAPSDKDFQPEKLLPLLEGLVAFVEEETAVSPS